MTDNIESQETILNHLIDNRFKSIIKKDSTPLQIFEASKTAAKTELEKMVYNQQVNINELQRANQKIENQLIEANKNIDTFVGNKELMQHKDKVSTSQTYLDSIKSNSDKVISENKQLKQRLRNEFIIGEIRKWKQPAK